MLPKGRAGLNDGPTGLKVENMITYQKNQDTMEMNGEKETTVKMMMVRESGVGLWDWGDVPRVMAVESWGEDRDRRQALWTRGSALPRSRYPHLTRGSMDKFSPFSEPCSSHLTNGCAYACIFACGRTGPHG